MTEISPHLWLAGFLAMLMVPIFIAWILAQLVLSKAEPDTDEHKIVKWWAALLPWHLGRHNALTCERMS